jgi:hypothetical protein
MAGLVLALAVAMADASGQPAAALLAPGSALPPIEGESLSGKRIALPEEAKGRAAVLLFTFSRRAGDAARVWSEAIAKPDVADFEISSYRILVLGGIPRLLRGFVVAGIKKGMPPSLHHTTLKLFGDQESWKARLGVRSSDDPQLVILDREGSVRWLHAGPCDDDAVQRLVEQLRTLNAESGSVKK